MSTSKPDRLARIKGDTFHGSDIVSIRIHYDKLCDKKFENSTLKLLNSNFLDDLERVLKTGELWKFNPTCLELFVNDKKFLYDRKALVFNVFCYGKITHQDIDRNSSLYSLDYSIRVLMVNARQIDEDIILNSPRIKVRTLMGMITI